MGPRDVIGLIVGTGRLPELIAEAVKARGHRLVCITIEANGAALTQLADHSYRTSFVEVERMRSILQRHGVRRVVLAGRVPRTRLIAEGDAAFRARLKQLPDRRDQTAFDLLAQLLAEVNITVVSPLEFVGELTVDAGPLTRRFPSPAEWRDIHLGMSVARALAAMDVGQTVVVKEGVILAVEAAEGTDATIQRAARMSEGIRVIKAARPTQDDRFDLPAVGLHTIEVLTTARASVLALEAGHTLMLDRSQCLAAADDAGIAVVGVERPATDFPLNPPS